MAQSFTAAAADVRENRPSAKATPLVLLVGTLFFAWGFATVLIDTLVPKLKGLFALNYAEAMLSQFAFFLAYLVGSVPASILLARIGYLRCIVVGLVVMMAGCLLFLPAATFGIYAVFLIALFIMAAGITILQVAANPLISVLGPANNSHSRLNLAQALNSLGTFIGPFVGAAFILKGGVGTPDLHRLTGAALAIYRRTEARAVEAPFLGIAALLAVLAATFWLWRNSDSAPSASRNEMSLSSLGLLRGRPRLALGALSLFLYVGAEVSIGSLMVNYLMQPKALAVGAATAGRLVALYWGGAMVGRLIGSAVMLKVRAGRVLCFCALGAATLAAISAASTGWAAAGTIIAIGLCNSVMFPTIFTLAIEGLGQYTSQGSGLVCMAIVGGAIVPLLTGALADHVGLSAALVAPIVCYLSIAIFAASTGTPRLAVGRAALD